MLVDLSKKELGLILTALEGNSDLMNDDQVEPLFNKLSGISKSCTCKEDIK
tara:strand:- start:1292 stop:1444 length:153 start_codon:yes stop_codon:yes gene_type:complete